MADEFKIEVHKREISNKKSDLKTLRKEKKIPGVYYSFDAKESMPLYIEKKSFTEAGKSGAKIFNIAVGKENKNVIFKSVQYHPVTDEVLHIDLYGVDMKRAVTVKVAIHLTGNAIGVTAEGGVLVQSLNEVEIECLPADIPDSLKLDVSELSIGDSLKVDNLQKDEKFEFKTALEQTIASVTHAMKEEEPDVSEEEGDEEFMEEGEEGGSSEEDSKEESGDQEKTENNEGK